MKQKEPLDLGDKLVLALESAGIQTGDRIVFVPDERWSLFPLHALPVESSHLGEVFADRYEIAYTRSLSVLEQCLLRPRPCPERLFCITDPTRDPLLEMPPLEAAFAQQHFASAQVTSEITHEALLTGGAETDVFYWIGHSRFQLDVPYWSGLDLHCQEQSQTDPKGERAGIRTTVIPQDIATFIDIDCRLSLPRCSLAILSGCQSGMAVAGKGNEPVSLVSAFLHAGAKCVVASLWPVDDVACMLTMQRFLHCWRQENLPIAAALRTAQLWLRDLTSQELKSWAKDNEPHTEKSFRDIWQRLKYDPEIHQHDEHRPFASPYFWAPFVAVGQSWEDAI